MKFYLRPLALSLCTLSLLAGCTMPSKLPYVQNRENDSLNARSIPPLNIPPGVSSRTFQQSYPVSDQGNLPTNTTTSLIPPGLEDK